MKTSRKIISALLAFTMVAGFMPQAGFAAEAPPQDTGKAIQLGTGGISGYDSATNKYDYIYYGNWTTIDAYTTTGPIKWRVLDDQTNTGAKGFFLLSEVLYGEAGHPNIQNWCNGFYSGCFSTAEQGAVLATTKSDALYKSSTQNIVFDASDNILNGDKVFLLSAEEVEKGAYGFVNDNARIANYSNCAADWWLRSFCGQTWYDAGIVKSNGQVNKDSRFYSRIIRPAFNLDSSTILFTSAATGGKSASGMDTGLAAVSAYNGNEWKLTLLDSSRKFAVTETTLSGQNGDTVTLNYTGATVGDNDYISAMITDTNGVQYYGRLMKPIATDGQLQMTIPASLAPGNYTLQVFSEQYNGDCKTDYSSALDPITMTVSDVTPPMLKARNITRESESTATLTFTANEAGVYYYAVTDGDVFIHDVDTSGAGIPYDTTQQTISLTNLKGAGKKRIFLVFKDASGNVSFPNTITIPLYPVHSIAADQAALTFESVTEGYQAAPAAQTVTITNTGNQKVTLTQPQATDFNIGALSATELAPNDTATFTVQPKDGLAVGKHSEPLAISGSNGVSASVDLSFEVKARWLPPVIPPSPPTLPPTVPEAEGGAVEVGPSRPSAGDTVTVTPKPQEGMVVDKIIVTDKNGNKIEVTKKPNGDFTFKQPSSEVTITVTFKPAVPSKLPFEDVSKEDYFFAPVAWAVQNNITAGVSATEFAPHQSCTRAQMVTFLWRANGAPMVKGDLPFTDVAEGTYYSDAVRWAVSKGIVAGTSATTFSPDATVTRAQTVTFLHRQAGEPLAGDHGFTDVADGQYYSDAVAWAEQQGITAGTSDTTFSPLANCTRAQIVTFLYRAK